jgi:hypothetical protein
MKITAQIRLSEAGQKDALRKGVCAKDKQEIVYDVDVTDRILAVARIHSDGSIVIVSDDDEKYLVDEQVRYGAIFYDSVPTLDDVLFAIDTRRQQVQDYEHAKSIEAEEKQKEHEEYRQKLLDIFHASGLDGIRDEFRGYVVERAIQGYELPEIEEAFQAEKEAEEKRKEDDKNRLETEKKTWIEKHGSDHLREVYAAGYPCQRAYVEERVVYELGEDWTVDFGDRCAWEEKVMPSRAAMELKKKLKKQGHEAEIVWLTDDGVEREYGDDEFSPCEAVVIRDYLSKYNVVRIM